MSPGGSWRRKRMSPSKVTTRLRTNLFWLGKEPLVKKKDYVIKLGTAKILSVSKRSSG